MNIECAHVKQEKNITKSLQGKKIYKDQCVRCFHQPQHENGLYVCLKCFNGFCWKDLPEHFQVHTHCLFLNIRMEIKNVQQKYQITKLAIGVEGGALGDIQYNTTYQVYCGKCQVHVAEGDELLKPQIQSLINTDSPFKKQSLVSWEVQINPCEHSLTLDQHLVNKNLMNCSNCQLSTNLWLCLTCGNTGCGRKNWDGTGGNSHAIKHFEETAHPLVVKLGTITAQGQASVYCYACNTDVNDQLLREHLIYLGIAIDQQKKTEKTVAEINLDLNLNYSLSKLVESKDKNIQNMYGPQYTGINNIGNSCYMNSILQFLNVLPEFRQKYYESGLTHRKQCKRIPSECFYCQFSKPFIGLNSGEYSSKISEKKIINEEEQLREYQRGINPYDFKLVLASNNQEFLSNRQQDALQYLQHVFDRLQKEEAFIGGNTANLFNYNASNRLECTTCHGYKLIDSKTNEWKVPLLHPTQQDIDLYYQKLSQETSEEMKKSKLCQDPEYDVQLKNCLELLHHGDRVDSICPSCQGNREFISRNYFKTTPKYLLMIPNRFVLEKWVPKKLNGLLHVDQKLNIDDFLLINVKNAGQLLTEQKQTKKKYSEENLQNFMGFGYSANASKRALIANNDNLEAAMNWIFDNMQKVDLEAPLIEENEKVGQSNLVVDEGLFEQFFEMGFDANQAKIALIKNNNDFPTSIEWLFNCGGDVSAYANLLQSKPKSANYGAVPQILQKPDHNNYELKAVIIHLGKSVHSGHYVAYVKKGGEWVLFNDEKVTVSNDPVLGKGYIYVYEGL